MVSFAKMLMVSGVIFFTLGLFFHFGDRFPGFKYLGNLPGDIRIEGKNFKVYIPWVTSLALSVAFSLVLLLIKGLKK